MTTPPPDDEQRPGWAQASPGNVPGEPPAYGPPGYDPPPYDPPPYDPVAGPGAPGPGAPGPGAPGPPGQPGVVQYGPPPGTRPKRFSGGFVLLGILASWAILVVPTAIAGGIVSAIGGSTGVPVLAVGVLSLLAPLVAGAVLVGRGSPQRRGFGLGLFIGWGLAVVIGGGACIALIVAFTQSGP